MTDNSVPVEEFVGQDRIIEVRIWRSVMDLHSSVLNRLNRAMINEFGITLAKFDVLAQLHRAPDGLTQGNLSRRLKVTSGNVTGLTSRLAADDLITREMSARDRRAFVVRLTKSGTKLYLAARVRHDALLRDILGGVEKTHLQQAFELLQIIGQQAASNREIGDT